MSEKCTSKFYGHRHDFLLDDTEYLCHKWQRIYSFVAITIGTRVPRSVPLEEEELLTFPVHLSSSLVLSGIRVAQFLLLCVMFCRTLFLILSWFFLSFGYCIVYPLSIYGFWLPIFKLLQTFLATFPLGWSHRYKNSTVVITNWLTRWEISISQMTMDLFPFRRLLSFLYYRTWRYE
jgi:hypothetical protein